MKIALLPYKLDKKSRFIINNLPVKIVNSIFIIIGYLTFYEKDFFKEGEF